MGKFTREEHQPEVEKRQQAEVTGEQAVPLVYTRREDFSIWARSSAFIDKYKALFWIIVFVLGSMGWKYISPNKQLELLAQNQVVMTKRQDSLVMVLSEVVKSNRILITGQCLDRPTRELALMGLECGNIQQTSGGRK